MPAQSDRQRRFVYAQARKGVAWAQKWVAEGKAKVVKKKRPKKKR